MKKSKKLAAGLLAVSMVLSMGATVLAEDSAPIETLGDAYINQLEPSTEEGNLIPADGQWKEEGNGWRYQKADGSYVASQWLYRNTAHGYKWFWFDENGMMTTGWQDIHGARYYMNASGEMHNTGWLYVDDTWYYTNEDGTLLTGWVKDGGYKYYMDDDGTMHFGWLFTDGAWYYMGKHGTNLTGWQYINENWYYFDTDGTMETSNWIKDSNTYYVDQEGKMVYGRQTIDGTDYYFDEENGALTALEINLLITVEITEG